MVLLSALGLRVLKAKEVLPLRLERAAGRVASVQALGVVGVPDEDWVENEGAVTIP